MKLLSAILVGAAASTLSFLAGYYLNGAPGKDSSERVYLVFSDADEAMLAFDETSELTQEQSNLVFNGPPQMSEKLSACDAGELFFSKGHGVHGRAKVAVDWLSIPDAKKMCVENIMRSDLVYWHFREASSPVELGL